ncbi:MAG: glutaredoxin-like protein NrdH, required for reduction of Ribonucleotide reductase class Ib [Microbacteriaceae bacterium]|nr:glutaredoxin-like protein NrdH, required for reduction of Ribonucleotide reductase class Ib [Microbacteriaceae bacterium]
MPQVLNDVIEAYWMPGCSSCLRMKEFIDKSGREFVAINTDQDQAARARLTEHGMVLPTIHVGDRWASGVDLAVVADLIGVDWTPPNIMPREELVERYRTNLQIGKGLILELTDEMLEFELPGRNRQMLAVADQVAVVIRAFLHQYYEDESTNKYYFKPDFVMTKQQVLDRLEVTHQRFETWWAEDGFDDPLDRVTHTYWGYPTLLEVLERETWHSTHHIRQLQYVLEQFGVTPAAPLTDAHKAGLPLPEGIHD